jgi:hypothetical protein
VIKQKPLKSQDADRAITQSESGNSFTAERKGVFNGFYFQIQHDQEAN